MPWFELGDKIEGRYLTREVTGTVSDVDFARLPHARTYSVKLDKPVDVSQSEHMKFERRRLTLHLNEAGESVDTKNRPDNIARMTKAKA
jgi:hypothetical protein